MTEESEEIKITIDYRIPKNYLQEQVKVTELQLFSVDDYEHLNFRWDRVLKIFENRKLKKDAKILDIGCRTGAFAVYMQKHGYHNVYGIDICKQAIEIAKNENKLLNHIVCDMHDMNFGDNEFDFILTTEVIEHSKDPVLLLKEIKRVLKNDGFVFSSVPIEGKPKNIEEALSEGHVWFFPHPLLFVKFAEMCDFKTLAQDLNLYPPDSDGKVWLQGCGFLLFPKQENSALLEKS